MQEPTELGINGRLLMAIVRLWSLAGTIAVIGLVYLLVENIYGKGVSHEGLLPDCLLRAHLF